MPLISVIVPTHNRPEMLADALASVREQTFKDLEIIVVSNGESADMRRASCEAAAGCAYFSLDEGNVSSARNYGVSRATGAWIAFLDDDDIWLPTKLERQLAMASRTKADMVTCDTSDVWPHGVESPNCPRVPDNWSHTKAISHYRWWTIPSATIIRKHVFDKVGGFDPNLSYVEDMDLWHRISWNHKIYHMNEAQCRHRQGHVNTFHRRNRRRRARWELRHYFKMRRITPPHLRDTLPHFRYFTVPRVVVLLFGAPTLRVFFSERLPAFLKQWLLNSRSFRQRINKLS
jgi:glycosyltransferase involved in cell wall biosynthesis